MQSEITTLQDLLNIEKDTVLSLQQKNGDLLVEIVSLKEKVNENLNICAELQDSIEAVKNLEENLKLKDRELEVLTSELEELRKTLENADKVTSFVHYSFSYSFSRIFSCSN